MDRNVANGQFGLTVLLLNRTEAQPDALEMLSSDTELFLKPNSNILENIEG
jgi:hypothetical protein